MPSSKKKGSKKKKNPSAKGERTAAVDGGGAELPPKRHTDDELFDMGHEFYLGECSICALPFPLDWTQFVIAACCTKIICQGCSLVSQLADEKADQACTCPFCWELHPYGSPSGNKQTNVTASETS